MTFSTPSVRNNIRADICTGLQQARVVSQVSRELHKMARADTFSTLHVGVVYHSVFLIARKRSRFHVTGKEEGRGRGRGGEGRREYRSIFKEIFVDLQRHYRCGARARVNRLRRAYGDARKRAVNPLFTGAYEPTGRRSSRHRELRLPTVSARRADAS